MHRTNSRGRLIREYDSLGLSSRKICDSGKSCRRVSKKNVCGNAPFRPMCMSHVAHGVRDAKTFDPCQMCAVDWLIGESLGCSKKSLACSGALTIILGSSPLVLCRAPPGFHRHHGPSSSRYLEPFISRRASVKGRSCFRSAMRGTRLGIPLKKVKTMSQSPEEAPSSSSATCVEFPTGVTLIVLIITQLKTTILNHANFPTKPHSI